MSTVTSSRGNTQDQSASPPGVVLPVNAALIIIDMQQGFGPTYWEYWGGIGGSRNNPEAERAAGDLLEVWRASRRPVFHVQHDSTNPRSPLRTGHPGHSFFQAVSPRDGEAVYHKTVNSAFIGTALDTDLRCLGIHTLVFVGFQTNHCVSTSVRMAANLGFTAFVVSDATATFDRTSFDGTRYPAALMHDTALATLHDEFATIVPASSLLMAAVLP